MRLIACPLLCLLACAAEDVVVEGEVQPRAMAVNETRTLELRYLELNVEAFERRLTLNDLRAVPMPILDELWLLDLPLEGFVENALAQIATAPPEQLETQSARNLQRLLTMSPDTADLRCTKLSGLIDVSSAIGIASADAVADLLQMPDRASPVIPPDIAARILLEDLIGTHPAAQFRAGQNGESMAVAPRSLPVTLGDVVDNFARMSTTFGRRLTVDGLSHPGIITAARGFAVVEAAFALTVKVNANALPYKGVELALGRVASVNAIGGQISGADGRAATVFALDDPNWLRVEGLVPVPYIEDVRFPVHESPLFLPAGTQRGPRPTGDSPVWQTPPFMMEHLVAEMGRLLAGRLVEDCVVYELGGGVEVFRACIDETGFVEFETFSNVGQPPPPQYIWDIVHELAQVRMHDGGLAEGEANAELRLVNLPLGVSAEQIVTRIRDNLAQNPAALRELAEATHQTTRGAADFYYDRPDGTDADFLSFIAESDIPRGPDGQRTRPYAYAHPGFFADAALTAVLGSIAGTHGDSRHHRLQVVAGQTLYVADDDGGVYRVRIGVKPSRQRLPLQITRIR